MTDGFRLVITQGPQLGQTFHLEGETVSIGRDPGNDVVINHPQVSRQHARLVRRGGLMVLEDLGSTNGTFVNGARLTTSHTLSNGDVIDLGGVVSLTFFGEVSEGGETIIARPGVAPSPPPAPQAGFQPPQVGSPLPQTGSPTPQAGPTPVGKRRRGLWIGLGCLGLLLLVCVVIGLSLWFAPASFWQFLIDLGIPVPTWPF